jgi:lipopolysaccharide export system protein LptC
VGLAKFVLPLVALALLSLLALWPELTRDAERGRFSYRRLTVTPEGGQLSEPRFRGTDTDGQPYTVTAATARQSGQDRTDLTEPKGDIVLGSGSWLLVQAAKGVFLQKTQQLDLAGSVFLYRDDGLVLQTESATMDLLTGAGAGSEMVHIEGPFGTLDAQGFTITDRGALLHFTGPARMILNGTTP